jgi:DNA polymerase elongation subunit (family B)
MLNPETGKGVVWYEAAERSDAKSDDGLFESLGAPRRTMLAEFWAALSKFDRFVTFNGRTFDGPFLSVRSAIHGLFTFKESSRLSVLDGDRTSISWRS